MGYSDSPDEAIAAWNRRTHPAGFSIIHDSENHGPTLERAAEAAEAQRDKALEALDLALAGLEAGCRQYAARSHNGSEVPGDEQLPWVRLMQIGRDAVRRALQEGGGE